LEIGKISNEVLDEILFSKIKYKHKDVLVGSGLAEDCSLIQCRDEIVVLSTDPITATANNIGKLSVLVSGNDVATKGVRPLGIMITLLAPPSVTLEELKVVINDVIDECNRMKIELIGGHTEVTDAVNRIVISATSIGKAQKERVVYGSSVEEGDCLVMTKTAATEGTVILYDDFQEKLKNLLTEEDRNQIETMRNGLSVLEEGSVAGEVGVSYMHDVTEGGILGAVWEVAEKFKTGVRIYEKNIPILQVTQRITDYFHIDPLQLISSGVLLIVVKEKKKDVLFRRFNEIGVKSQEIGHITKKEKILVSNGRECAIRSPKSDELYRVYKEEL